MKKKMLFKFGLTVIIFVAVYMYFAIKKSATDEEKPVYDVKTDTSRLNKDLVVEREESFAELDGNEDGNDLARSADHVLESDIRNTEHFKNGMHLSVVACGERLQETVVMLKSAVLFSRAKLFFHIFAEDSLHKDFKDQLEFWPPSFRERVRYIIYNISFPASPSGKPDEWKKLFKPCASQRLFIPALLKDVDSLLYVDTDIIFLSPVDKIWSFFSKFNSSQLAAVAPEHEDHATGWYNRFARHPFYGELGINSGVMLMNLTRMRRSSWLTLIKDYYQEYKLKITYGDQDLINIYFHFHPEQLYMFSCEWNYRPDHCMYMSVCKAAEKTGAYVLHGCRRVWHENKQPAFKAVYQAFEQHELGSSIQYVLLSSIKNKIDSAPVSNCGKLGHIFTTQIQTFSNTTHQNTHRDMSANQS